jgi:C4-type Zn-finger protein
MESASACPICSQTLQLGTSEPHPTRDGVDILTYRCEQCGPIKSKLVVHRIPSQGMDCSTSLRAGSLANSR